MIHAFDYRSSLAWIQEDVSAAIERVLQSGKLLLGPETEAFEAEFEDRFKKRAHLIDSSPGFVKNLVLRPVNRRFNHQTGQIEEREEQGYYLVQTYWESEQAFWDWTNSESFRLAHGNRPPAEMFAGPSVLEIHEVIQTTEHADKRG